MNDRPHMLPFKHSLSCITHHLAVLAALFLVRAHAAIPAPERILPADTLFVLSVPDCTQLGQLYERSPQTKLWRDPAMKPFREKLMKKVNEEIVEPLERELAIKLNDYASLLQGQLTTAFTLNESDVKEDQSPAFLLLLDTRDKSGLLKTNLAHLRSKWVESGKSLRTEKVRDVEFSILVVSSNDIPASLLRLLPERKVVQELGKETPPAPKREIMVGQFESLLIVSTAMKPVEQVMARLGGGSVPPLADVPHFEANRLAVFRDAPMFAWINTKQIVEIVSRIEPEPPNPDAPSMMPQIRPGTVLSALGFDGLQSVAFAFRDEGGGLIDFVLSVPESSRKGLFKILAPEAKDSNPPRFVPADAVQFQRWRLDLQKAIATIEKTVGDLSPQAINFWDFMLKNANEAARQQSPDFDIRRDLFGNLGDDLMTWEKAPRGITLEQLSSPPSVFLLGSVNPEKLAASLKFLLMLRLGEAMNPKEREFLGRKIYSITMPGQGGSAGGGAINYAASSGYLAISTDVSTLEEYLRSGDSEAKALRETAGLNEAAQKVGGQNTGIFGFENQVETMKTAFKLLKEIGNTQSGASQDFNPLTAALPFASPQSSFKEWMDFSLLPDYGSVEKYFHIAVYSGQANADGIRFKVFSPNPPPPKVEAPN